MKGPGLGQRLEVGSVRQRPEHLGQGSRLTVLVCYLPPLATFGMVEKALQRWV